MHIGLDATDLIVGRVSGVPRYGESLIHALLRVAPENRYTLFVSGREDWFGKEALESARERFAGAQLKVLFGGLTPHRPSETNIARRWRMSRLLRPADALARRAYARVNENASGWAAAIRRGGARAAAEEPQVMHHLSYGIHYPFRRSGNVIMIHDLIARLFPEWTTPATRRLLRRALRFAKRCEAVVVNSECTRRDLISAGFLPRGGEKNIVTIPLAAEGAFRPLDSHETATRLRGMNLDRTPFFLYVGTLEPRKNLPVLIAAFAEMLKRFPEQPMRLVLAGRKGWGYEPVFDEIARRSLTNQVTHIDGADDETLAALMNAAIALIYPSLYEGFGLPAVEAMACGCPVITSDRASLPEVVGEAGIQVNPEVVAEIVDAMTRIRSDDSLRESLRGRGLERVKQFSWDRLAERTLTVYEKAAGRCGQ